METPYSKQDEMIDGGVQALRDQTIDTSNMAKVLGPRAHRSIVLPVGLATAAACAIGAVVLMTPTKADAGEFEKVKKAVQNQKAVVERVFERTKDQKWQVRLETWKDGDKKGTTTESPKGLYQVVLDGPTKYKKTPEDKFFVKLDKSAPLDLKEKVVDGDFLIFVDTEYVEEQIDKATINEILARDGMHFLGIQRSQKKEGRPADIYHVKMNDDVNETIYYVDPKTDLPFLMEEVRADGYVVNRVAFDFPGEIKLDIKFTGKDVLEIARPLNKTVKDIPLHEAKGVKLSPKVIELKLDLKPKVQETVPPK